MISRAEVFAIADHYPESKRKLRMYVCRVAFRRFFILMTREKKQLAELRVRFPDTLGALLDRLEAGAERLRDLKNAGVYGGWAGEDPDPEEALRKHALSPKRSKSPIKTAGDAMLAAFGTTSTRPEVTTVCTSAVSAHHHAAHGDERSPEIQTGKPSGALLSLRAEGGTPRHADFAHSMAMPTEVAHPHPSANPNPNPNAHPNPHPHPHPHPNP